PAGGGRVRMASGLFDGDFFTDVAAVVPGTDELLVFRGNGTTLSATPDRYASSGHQPVAVVAGHFTGDALTDLAVAHRDGTVTLSEGLPGAPSRPTPALPSTGLGAVADLTAADVNGDGAADLAVSSGSGVVYLRNDYRVTSSSPLVNGDFSAGLTGWTAT